MRDVYKLLPTLFLLFTACSGGSDEYKVLVTYGHFVCDDRAFEATCDNSISVEHRNMLYTYKLPPEVKSRLDAKIYYWQLAEVKCPTCKLHKFPLKDSLLGRGRKEDFPMILKLQHDMKVMGIFDPNPAADPQP